ncbi:MAG: ion transporter [Cyclobacteriaceae bacterium]
MEEEEFKRFRKIRNKLYVIVFGTDTKAGKMFDVILLVAIVLSIFVVMLESVNDIKGNYEHVFYFLEWSFTIIFTIEFLLRLFITRKPTKYAFSFFGLVDLISLLPTYISLFVTGGSYLVVIRAIRLLRVFRILKLSRYLEEATVLATALNNSKRKILVFMGAVFTLVMITGTLMYMIEGGENGFTSIPRSIYWAVVTVTTVGYGDIAPQTVIGQAFATALMLAGYAIIAVPTGIMTSEINKAALKDAEKSAKELANCPRCETGNTKDSIYCKRCGEKMAN